MSDIPIGIIGGSGLYRMEGLSHTQEHRIDTPFGAPSDVLVSGRLGEARVVFLARHGRSHSLTPTEIPFRANLWALKSLGVRWLLSVSAVGSLHEDLAPLDAVLPDQFIDLTRQRAKTFFGAGVVAHVGLAQPVCPALADVVVQAHAEVGFGRGRLHRGGSYVCIEGPQFSTLAESQLYRSWGARVIGMTNMPEAALAREAEIAYATLALVTDYDCWHPTHGTVTVDMAIANLMENAGNAQRLVGAVVQRLHAERPASEAHWALSTALITPPQAIDAAARARLAPLLARVLGPG
jgi:5'-methylthioadenosine phosphorylase